MANLNLTINSKAAEGNIKVRELKDNVTLAQAIEKTQANGMDEAFVEADGKRYVIFSEDNVSLEKANIQIDGKAARIVNFSNEINSFGEGISYVPKKTYQVGKAALEPIKYVVPNAGTGIAIAAGVAAGALTRNSFTPFTASLVGEYDELTSLGAAIAAGAGVTTGIAGTQLGQKIGENMTAHSDADGKTTGKVVGWLGGGIGVGVIGGLSAAGIMHSAGLGKTGGIGIAAGALIGVASATAASDQTSKSAGARQAKAWATSVGSLAVGVATPEIAKLINHIHIPEIAVKGAKIVGVAALVGGTMATIGLAAAGGLKSAKKETIDEIAK